MNWQRIGQAFASVFSSFSSDWVAYLLEFILFVAIVYLVLRVLGDNNAGRLIVVYVFGIVLIGLCCLTFREFADIAFLSGVALLSVFMLLLFSVEIKRSIWAKGTPDGAAVRKVIAMSSPETEACIEAIIKACQNMSKNDVGALIVLSNGNLPKQILESGTMINADISQQMIEGIFFPKAPLHDGALIIQEHKLLAAGCFLPLTQNNEKYSKDLGTRHRAGVGITEVTNVTSIIVSEETGIISIVKQGKIERYADYNMLRRELQEYYWKDFTQDGGKKKSVIRSIK